MNQSNKKCIKVLKTLLLFNRVHIFHWMYIFIKQIHIHVKRHIYPFFKYTEFSGTKPCKYVVEYPNNYKAANFGDSGSIACSDNLYSSAIQFTLSFASYHLINRLL